MSSFNVEPSRLRASAGELQAVEYELGGLRAAAARLGAGGHAAFSPSVAGSVDSVEETWIVSFGALQLGVSNGAATLERTSTAYEQVDRVAMPVARAGG